MGYSKIVAPVVGLLVMVTAACGSEEPPVVDYDTVGTYEDAPPTSLEIDPTPTPSPVDTPKEYTDYEYEYTDSEADSEYEDLESEYEDLEGEYEDLEDEYDDLEDEYEED